MSQTLTYEKSGVNIAAGESLVERIKKINPTIGGFAGLYPLDAHRSLVACADGVGTKLELGIEMERYEELGQDLVAMSVNDLIVCGARPLFFLDYFATGKLNVDVAHRVVSGIARACEQVGCLLLGGETAEMPGFYDNNKFDLAGFAVGEVLHSDLVNGNRIVAGDMIFGLPSSGFHANGYSLIRKILRDQNLSLQTPFAGEALGHWLTLPTTLYVNDILRAKKELRIKGMAHITGGGLTNISRVLPKGLQYKIEKSQIPTPAFMKHIQNLGEICEEEAFTVWNMGMGFVIIVKPEEAANVAHLLPQSFYAGTVVESPC